MSKLTEQLREALGKIDDETGIVLCVSSMEEKIIDVRNLLPALLTEHEKLEREASDFAHGADELGDKPHRFFSDLLKLVEKYHPDYTFAMESVAKWRDAVGNGMNPDNFEKLEREAEERKKLFIVIEDFLKPDTKITSFELLQALSAYRTACEK